MSGVKNTTQAGGYDGYLMGFTAAGKATFTVQTGTAGTDSTSAIAVDGNTVYASSIEDGNVILRAYTPTRDNHERRQGQPGHHLYRAGGLDAQSRRHRRRIDQRHGDRRRQDLYRRFDRLQQTAGRHQHLDQHLFRRPGRLRFAGRPGPGLDRRRQGVLLRRHRCRKGRQGRFFSDGKAWISGSTTGDIAGTTAHRHGRQDAGRLSGAHGRGQRRGRIPDALYRHRRRGQSVRHRGFEELVECARPPRPAARPYHAEGSDHRRQGQSGGDVAHRLGHQRAHRRPVLHGRPRQRCEEDHHHRRQRNHGKPGDQDHPAPPTTS